MDTLNLSNNPVYRFWGNSPTNLWAISSGNWDKSISHFDGEKWSSYGVSGLFVPSSIFGFSNNNIFIGSENGQIWRFDGSRWNPFVQILKNERNDIIITNIWGEYENDFYAFGAYPDENSSFNNSVIAHFNNGTGL